VLALSLRAHGDSTGTRNQVGLDASEDVRAAVGFLRARSSERPLIVSGFSVGAAAALYATDMLEGRVQGYLLDSPYASLRRAVRNRTRAKLPWGLDWLAYQGLCAVGPLFLVRPLDDYAPSRGLTRIPEQVPVTLVGSEKDMACMADELHELARARRGARLVLTSHEGHRPLCDADPGHYMAEFERVLRASRAE
jgi:pimeloyl-ACP methyl ester carboxylesterase